MPLSRREFVAGTAGLLASSRAAFAAPSAEQAFTFVHLTDQHVTPRRHGDEGYRRCIAAINAIHPAPDFVLMGGDMVFDGCYTAKDDYENQIRLFKDITAGLKYPWHPCMGNHDVLGWSPREKVEPSDPGYGKKRIMQALDWKKSYYSFDHKGWHFAVLDSASPATGEGGRITQEPRIGAEQLEWLGYDLGAAGDRPKIAVVHVAAFCNIGQIAGDPKQLAMNGMVVADTKELRRVLERHQVKVLLQGHSHRVEDTFWNGVWYITSPGASGAWWAGSWTGSDPGYSILRCETDPSAPGGGRVTWTHESYPWEPQLDEADTLERRKIAEQQADRAEQKRLLQLERAGRA